MRDLSLIELKELIKELKQLNGFYIDQFYETGDDKFRFKLSKNKEKIELQAILAKTINKTSYVQKTEEATNFTLAVRKRITGFQIQGIEQYNNDRIIIFELGKRDAKSNIIFEMFGQGNLVLTDDKMNILLAYKLHDFKDRSVKPGIKYVSPKNEGMKKQDVKIIKPLIYRDQEGKAVDYSVIENEKYAALDKQGFESLQEALDLFYYENQNEKKQKKNPKIEEFEVSLKKQEHIISQIDLEINNNKMMGEILFKKMNEVNEIIKSAKSNKKVTKEELQNMFPNFKILEVNLKDKTITFEMIA